MGKRNSKCHYRSSTTSHFQPLLSSSYDQKSNNHFNLPSFRLQQKKKVLLLGLDGVGKTHLFTRLISDEKQPNKFQSFPQPTIGYNVETIKLQCPHLYHRHSHRLTLWDCGGQPSLRPLWPYHFANTSLLLWLINIHDRSRFDLNLQLLSQLLTNRLLDRIPILIVLYDHVFPDQSTAEKENLLTNLEVAFRFLATLSTSRASTFKWQVISIRSQTSDDLKKIRRAFVELMDL